ncbi:uncharacterized protein A1O9_05045 [Exophiala aquamarina CBS 119918]|uniref:Uncharacterized protein n=1 Tax=Exophiala aquamarina CBS 119918 TaxID=1182545 RepID=A0A072PX73_9EURO|nr:uncharacterized protein A1O9_05045 [Exophiala aquamarina CBS 119918]KEF60195.1 hypothetical protein A1O9_05045 [Exophiala aquamarina CBS 119918]
MGLAIYNAVFNKALTSNIRPKVAQAALSNGLLNTSIEGFIAALASGNQSSLQGIEGVTPGIITASVLALKEAYVIGFRNVFTIAAAFSVVGLDFSLFLKDPKDEFTTVIDAPILEAPVKHDWLG